MAATHASVVKRVLADLTALPDDAGTKSIEKAVAPLRDLFASFGGLAPAERRERLRRITGMLAYRQLDRRHAQLTNQAGGVL